MEWFGLGDSHIYAPSCGIDPLSPKENLFKFGPSPIWESEDRDPAPANVELYMYFDMNELEGKPFELLEIPDGVGVQGGYQFELGLPMIGELLINNEW